MMKRVIIFALISLFALSVTGLAQTTVSPQDTRADQDTEKVKAIDLPFKKPPPAYIQFVPNQLVVELKSEVGETTFSNETRSVVTGCKSLDELNKKYGVKIFIREFPDPGAGRMARAYPDLSRYYILTFDEKYRLEEVLKAYSNDSYVVKAEPIGVHPVYESIPNDSYFLSDQWNFYDPENNDVDATMVWDYETGDETVILGLLDTGLQYNSRDLGGSSPYTQGNVWINWAEYNGTPKVDDDGNGFVDDWIGWDFVDGVHNVWPGEDSLDQDNEPTDFNGHGTHVSGIMGAITNNGTMVAGLAGGWNPGTQGPSNGVKIMGLRIGWSAPHPVHGYEVGYVRMDFAAQAIYYAANQGATAINCSWGSSNTGGLGAAVDYATANDVLVVAAAGNDGDSYPDYLGTRTDVINVCATDDSDIKAYFSDYGTWVDVAAPGVDIISTYSYHYNPNYVAWANGTSQAAPHVVAEAGILKSYADTLTRDQIESLIRTYTDDIDGLNPAYAGLMGSGRINVFKAVDGITAPSVTVIQPNGGEVLYIGQIYTIMWEAEDNIGIVSTTIDYSVDGGGSWMHVVDLEGNPESYDWTVTGPPSSECRMRVTCYDAVGLSGWDMSDEDFCPPYKLVAKGFSIASNGTLPEKFALYQNSPNPFNPQTVIKYALAKGCNVTLEVYNLLGQKVTTLVDENLEAGEHSAGWDGTDSYGAPVGTGIYLYRIKADNFVQTRKMVLMK